MFRLAYEGLCLAIIPGNMSCRVVNAEGAFSVAYCGEKC